MHALIEELGSFCVLWSSHSFVTFMGLFLRPSLNVVGKHSRITPENKLKEIGRDYSRVSNNRAAKPYSFFTIFLPTRFFTYINEKNSILHVIFT